MIPIRDTIPSRSVPVVTWSLITINLLIFLGELAMPPQDLEHTFFLFGVVPARYTYPAWAERVGFPADDYWPFVTSMFLHGGWAHVLGNMWTLWIFGDNVEDRMGRVRFIVFYLLTGVAAGVTHWLTNSDSTIPTVGASGAIAGVLGAYFFLFPHSRIIVLLPILFFPFFFELPAVFYLGFWFLSQVYSGALAGLGPDDVQVVAWWAHVGGFAAGILIHQFLLLPRRRREPDEYAVEDAWTQRPSRW